MAECTCGLHGGKIREPLDIKDPRWTAILACPANVLMYKTVARMIESITSDPRYIAERAAFDKWAKSEYIVHELRVAGPGAENMAWEAWLERATSPVCG